MKKKLTILFLALLIPAIVLAFTYDWEIDYMEYSSDALAQAAYVSSEPNATGGTITTDGNYKIHTFLTNGTFTPAGAFDVEYLVVGGGGGGGGYTAGGGGGGAFKTASGFGVTAQAYSIVVGGGGTGGVSTGSVAATNGIDSVFSTVTAIGGGFGGSFAVGGYAGGTGASGGGACYTGAAGTGTDGNTGGVGSGAGAEQGGGGGGASAVGQAGNAARTAGAGGAGSASSISGSSVQFSGGGGAGTDGSGTGGSATFGGGAGTASNVTGGAGSVNTGGGGGGSGGSTAAGGAGGSGIVIIRYLGAPKLQSYSESTIKQQGSYSLKGVAAITASLNDTLTKTLTGADKLDLTYSQGIEYDIYALRTGSNIKIGIHDSGGTTSEHTANVVSSNTNQTESWDISAISDANKDDIDSIIVTVVNADAANIFYLDDIKWGIDAVAGGGSYTFVQ